MHVILMSDRLGRSFSFRFGARHVATLGILMMTALAATGYLGFSAAGGVETTAAPALTVESSPQVDQLAIRVGELQARLERLSVIGRRLAAKTGIPVSDLSGDVEPGRGGPLLDPERQPATAADIAVALDELAQAMELASDHMMVLDAELLLRQASQGKLLMDRPVDENSYVSSVFGRRIDPFTGRRARHEGIDFSGEMGAPILAAENGVVLSVSRHPQYGNSLIIDHGNGLTTRYAHASRLLVKQGDLVKRGQPVAEIGSTGRSTGPHLHFEVLKNGVPQNPLNYLSARS